MTHREVHVLAHTSRVVHRGLILRSISECASEENGGPRRCTSHFAAKLGDVDR